MSIPITDKYLLYKPGLGNEADIRVLNHNTDNIDNGMYQNRRMIGDAYDPESTASNPYMTDDLVVKQTTIYDESDNPQSYSFQYYRCLEDNVYGPWDATKWEITDIATELKRRSGGGASSLADLTDTDIDSPAVGEVLTYDGENWVNAEGSASVTKEASGNPIELTDAASAPMVKCVTEIQGSQDLHGYDKPWVGGAGSNKWDEEWQNGRVNLTTGEIVSGNGIVSTNLIPVVPSTSYRPIRGYYDGASAFLLVYFDSNEDFISYELKYGENTIFTTPSNAYYLRFNVQTSSAVTTYNNDIAINYPSTLTTYAPYSNICPITSYTEGEIEVRGKNLVEETYANGNINASGVVVANQSSYDLQIAKVKEGVTYTITSDELLVGAFYYTKPTTGSVSYNGSRLADAPKTFTAPIDGYIAFRTAHGYATPQCEEGSTPTTYEPYIDNTYTIDLDGTRYRGTLDVVRGMLNVTHGIVSISEFYGQVESNGFRTSISLPNVQTAYGELLCNMFSRASTYNEVVNNYDVAEYRNRIGYNSNGVILLNAYVNGAYVTDFTTLNALIPSEGCQIVYPLATPIEVQLSPTQIRTLSGYNHIESSTGDMEVEYITEEYQPIVDLIESNKHVYSTAEQIVGTWIDGKTVYEKTMTGSFSNASTARTWHDILSTAEVSELAIDKFFISSGSYIIDPDGDIYTVPQTTGVSTGSAVGAIISGGKLQMVIEGMGSGTVEYALTIRYTKATAQTRSLSLSKGEISGEKKKADETPIEEEKAVENDLDEWLEDSDEIEEEVDEGTDEDSDVEEEEENEATNE